MNANFTAPPPNRNRPRRRSRKGVKVTLILAGAVGLGLAGVAKSSNEPAQSTKTAAGIASASLDGIWARGRTEVSRLTQAASAKVQQASLEPVLVSATKEPGGDTAAAADPTASGAATPAVPPGTARGNRFDLGDKVQIVFYERVDNVEADKWGRDRSALHGFQERPELSGTYTVQDDGAVTLPLLGSFALSGRTSRDLQTALADAFEKLTGRKALVSVVSIARPPIYVLGPVKKPGPYAYMPGMTVLHAIAMAGGFGSQEFQPWQQLEAVREVEQGRGSLEDLPRLLAQRAVLQAERDGATATPDAQLVRLVGATKAKKLVAGEVARQRPIVSSRDAQKQAIEQSLQTAQREVRALSKRQQPLDNLIALRHQRAAAMEALAARHMVANIVLIQAQSELADSVQRRQDVTNQYTNAQQRVNELQQQQAKFDAETKSAIDSELATLGQQIRNDDRQAATSQGVLSALGAINIGYTPNHGNAGWSYEIVRQGKDGPVELSASGLTTLRPGDLVKIAPPTERGLGDAQPQAASARVEATATPDSGSLLPVSQLSAR